ncbi:hypothetical protein [Paraburkholderia jirisanensis]
MDEGIARPEDLIAATRIGQGVRSTGILSFFCALFAFYAHKQPEHGMMSR